MSVVAAVALSFATPAAAKTFTVHVDDPSHVSATHPDTYEYVSFSSDNTAEITTERGTMIVNAVSGWLIASATNKAGESIGNYTTFPTDNASLDLDKVKDGETINITTSEAPVKTFTLIGDTEHVIVTYNYGTIEPADGKWVIKESALNGSTINVMPANDDYAIVKVVDEAGAEYTPSSGTVYISCYSFQTDKTFTISVRNLAETRTATMTVNVVGNGNQVDMRRADNSSVTLSTGENTVPFDPETEVPFTVAHNYFGMTLYKVEIENGGTVEPRGSSYQISPVNGSKLNIEVDYPDIDVPVNFTFTNEGTENVLSNIQSNNQNVSGVDGKYTVKLGTKLNVSFNTTDYDIASITLNGSPITLDYYGSYSTTLTETTPLDFVVDATAKKGSNITIVAENPEGLIVYKGYSYNEDILTLSGTTTAVELPASVSGLTIKPVAGYRVSYIEVGSNTYSAGDLIPVSDGMELLCGAELIVRDKPLTVFVENTTWQYRQLSLCPEDYEMSVRYTDDDLHLGYSTIMFCDGDVPMSVSGYPSPHVYLNDEKCESYYGSYRINAAANDVLKIFAAEPSKYAVTYDIDSEASVEVRHDITTVIDNPSSHNVFAGTEIHIRPALAIALDAAAEAEETITVTANDAPVAKDTEGKYVITVNGDTAVKVAPKKTDSIDEIKAAGVAADAPVYNLQGIQVGIASGLDRLPAGIYIVDGRKVKI